MADTVKVQVLTDGPRHLIVKMTNTSDGTGEAGVQKVDLSATSHAAAVAAGSAATVPGKTLSSVAVEEIWWSIGGFDWVKLLWDHTADSVINICSVGDGYIDYRSYGGLRDDGSGGNGDVLATTGIAATANDTYSITVKFRKVWVDS